MPDTHALLVALLSLAAREPQVSDAIEKIITDHVTPSPDQLETARADVSAIAAKDPDGYGGETSGEPMKFGGV
jgi:hypothetical protein